MEQIKLNKENPEIEFKLNSADSYLLIKSVSVTLEKNGENHWSDFISKVRLNAELKYVVFIDPKGRFSDDRVKQILIPFLPDLNQVQPVFHLNALIKNESFTSGINPELKFYKTLKLELQDIENLDEEYNLELDIERFKIDV